MAGARLTASRLCCIPCRRRSAPSSSCRRCGEVGRRGVSTTTPVCASRHVVVRWRAFLVAAADTLAVGMSVVGCCGAERRMNPALEILNTEISYVERLEGLVQARPAPRPSPSPLPTFPRPLVCS